MNLVEKKEHVLSLPLIPKEEFSQKVNELAEKNWLVKKLIKDLGSWENFAPHLIDDLFCRIGAKPIINKY